MAATASNNLQFAPATLASMSAQASAFCRGGSAGTDFALDWFSATCPVISEKTDTLLFSVHHSSSSTTATRIADARQMTDPYNRRLPDSFRKSLGKSALIVAGLGYGLFRGLRAIGAPGDRSARIQLAALTKRLDEIERTVAEMSKRRADVRATPPASFFVTHEELAEAIDRTAARIDADLDRKLQSQSRAVNSLRAMIAQTDILLQRVLEGIENVESESPLVER
jgi:hypothetical protein